MNGNIKLKTMEEISKINKCCIIANDVLLHLAKIVRPGISTIFLDEEAFKICKKKGAYPAFLGYNGYPNSLCVSINDEVVHGIPREEKTLKEGDVVSFDFGVQMDGYYGDCAITVGVGKIDFKAQRLIEVTKECLRKAIKYCKIGNRIGDVSAAIQEYAEREGFTVIRDYVGHGIGSKLHEPPPVPNYGRPGEGPALEEGMVIAIEPMVCEGSWEVKVDEDGWTVRTVDGKNAAHFECCVAITKNGPILLGSEVF